MGRHTDPNDDSFRRSLLRAIAGGVAAVAVTVGIVGVLMTVGRTDGAGGTEVSLTGPSAVPTTRPAAGSPTARPQAAAEATTPPAAGTPSAGNGRDEPTDEAPAPPDARPPGDVTVQVLSAGGTREQTLAAVEVLTELGYDVVAVNPTSRDVDATTVLATPGARPEARQLVRADERFKAAGRNTVFSPTVDLHVLVGADFGA